MADLRGRWLTRLQEERARRAAAKAETVDGEAIREQLLDTLQEMARRLALATPLHPLQIDDMSPAEMMACHFLPEHLRPVGLADVDEVWALYEARK